MTELDFVVDRLAEPLTVHVVGEIDMHTAPDLRRTVSELVAEHPTTTLRLDIGEVGFLDSSGLSAIIAAHKALAASAGRLVLARPTPMVRRMLAVTGLSDVLTVENGDQVEEGTPVFGPGLAPGPAVPVNGVGRVFQGEPSPDGSSGVRGDASN
jgi:anti-anti-sigma factor